MNSKERAILKAVDALSDDILDLTCRLTAEPSVLGNEASAVRVMEDALVGLGYDPVRVPIDPVRLSNHPGYAPVPWEYSKDNGRNNLVSVIKGKGSGPTALFNGHLDVVSPEPADFWTNDPFMPLVKDGRIYGRGAGDMKAGVAAMTYAYRALEKAGFGLQGDLILEAVIEEECCGNGALACLDAGYDADAVLIPEPFGPTILTNQVGVMWFKVVIRGLAGHVLNTKAGANALEKLYPIIRELRGLEEELNAEPHPPAYADMPHPLNLNIGIINGGDWPSTVPAFAEMHCRLSFFPGTTYEEICERISETVRNAASEDPWLSVNQPKTEFYGFRSEGHSLSPDLPPLKVLAECHESIAGRPPQEYIATCTTDLRAFTSYGKGHAACYGPKAQNIHGADESVEIDSIIRTAETYALFLARWCGLTE